MGMAKGPGGSAAEKGICASIRCQFMQTKECVATHWKKVLRWEAPGSAIVGEVFYCQYGGACAGFAFGTLGSASHSGSGGSSTRSCGCCDSYCGDCNLSDKRRWSSTGICWSRSAGGCCGRCVLSCSWIRRAGVILRCSSGRGRGDLRLLERWLRDRLRLRGRLRLRRLRTRHVGTRR